MHRDDNASQRPLKHPWHTFSVEHTQLELQTGPDGLSDTEARARLTRYGPNRLTEPSRRGPLMRLLSQFHNVLLYAMMGAAVITALLGHWLDTAVLMAAVVVNALIGFVQEGKAESALAAIRGMLAPHATVVRAGARCEIDATTLVPGDVVVLASGDRVPADLRLIASRELRVDEAALTGESEPVQKTLDTAEDDAALGDRWCMAYAGTVVVYGQATGIVVATGAHTELGRINHLLTDVDGGTTPLLRQIDRFGHGLAGAIAVVAVLTFVLGWLWRGEPAGEMFMVVVALVASAIPEGLPAIMTVILARGVQRMAREKAIVRRLPAVETLGSVTVICSDKTGTLTRNEMTVQRVVSAGRVYHVSGVGYAPDGKFSRDGADIDPMSHPELGLAARAGVLCNDARLLEDAEGHWRIEGDPTEGALLVLGAKAGLARDAMQVQWPRLDTLPFESQHRFMATYHTDSTGAPWLFVKGAPERIFEMCRPQVTGSDGPVDASEENENIDDWRRMVTDTAAQGLRVLALAYKRAKPAGARLAFGDFDGGFTLLALVGIIDPPRAEAIAAVAECHRAGIRVKMITGDHAETARAIGAQLDIGVGKPAVTGAEVALMDDAELRRVALEIDVFARASPEHKLRLVQALQNDGQVVAMTGDGVNDAPALKRADVGVAMGFKGTEAAKEAADIVLTDDNFASIAKAVRQGRGVYDNLKKFILFMLPTNGGEALVVIAGVMLALGVVPLTPAQVLWINMVTSSTLGIALAFERAEPGIMTRTPRPPGTSLLSWFFVWRVTLVSVLMMIGTFGLFYLEWRNGASIEAARTMAVNALVVAEMFYLISSRSIFASSLSWQGVFGNRIALLTIAACLMLQMVYTYVPFMQTTFGSAALDVGEWLEVIGAGLLVFFGAELEKWVVRRAGWAERLATQ
ncbi:carbonate dehydratase [Pandoraea anhela]|uniref:Carbonate dehydratase n=2 Tax=Pandoraea anhela TaxID=2508295 RepID=A0A5E4VIS8_9BURK|nr:carbonate dehydratase [Pandoraea anhela]